MADIYTVSKLLGHASVKTTEKYYVDLVEDNYKSALNGLDKIYLISYITLTVNRSPCSRGFF